MADFITVKVDARGFLKVIQLGGNLGRVYREGVRQVDRVVSKKVANMVNVRRGRTKKAWLSQRKSKFVHFKLRATKKGAWSVHGPRLPGWRLYELGGTIKPKRGKKIAVPLGPALSAKGVPKRKSPRAYKNLVAITSKKGNLLLARIRRYKRKNRPPKITPFYKLVDEVTFKGHHTVDKAVRAMRSLAPRIMDFHAQKEINKRLREGATL